MALHIYRGENFTVKVSGDLSDSPPGLRTQQAVDHKCKQLTLLGYTKLPVEIRSVNADSPRRYIQLPANRFGRMPP